MILFEDKEDFRKSILIRNLIDIEHLAPYEEVAIRRKIYPFIPQGVINQIQSKPELYSLLKKAVAHYMMPIAMPLIKVTFSNAGISQLKDGDLKNAKWWDVRDMALQCVQIADQALTDLIDALLFTELKEHLPFLEKFQGIVFKTPDDFFQITQQKGGYDVFMRLIPNIKYVWEYMIKSSLPSCVFDDLENNPELLDLIKKATAFYVASESTSTNGIVFTQGGLFLIWEQLPWQKSALLNDTQLKNYRMSMLQRAKNMMNLIWKLLNSQQDKFPCLQDFKTPERKVHIRKSGLYF